MEANREATGFPWLPSSPQLNPQSCRYLQTGREGQALSLPGAEILLFVSALFQGLGLPWGGKLKAEGGQTGSREDVAGQRVRGTENHWEASGTGGSQAESSGEGERKQKEVCSNVCTHNGLKHA